MIRTLAITLFALPLLIACGSDPLTKAETEKAWPTTGATMHDRSTSSGALEAALTEELGISVSAPCPEGGKVEVSVSLSDIANAANGDFAYEVGFDDCENQGLTMNGEVKYMFGFATDGATTTLEWGWSGDLEYDGTLATPPCAVTDCTVEGDCEFDMTGRLSVTAGGTEGAGTDPTTVEIEYSGNICGHEAGTWLNITTP